HPPHNLARDQIDIDAIAKIPGMGARGTPREGRTQVVPVRVPARIAGCVIGLSPEELERVRTHPDPDATAPDSRLVEGIKRLEALHQPQLLEVNRARGGSRLRNVCVDLACGHNGPIESKLRLFCGRQPLYRGVICAPGEYDHEAEQHT